MIEFTAYLILEIIKDFVRHFFHSIISKVAISFFEKGELRILKWSKKDKIP